MRELRIHVRRNHTSNSGSRWLTSCEILWNRKLARESIDRCYRLPCGILWNSIVGSLCWTLLLLMKVIGYLLTVRVGWILFLLLWALRWRKPLRKRLQLAPLLQRSALKRRVCVSIAHVGGSQCSSRCLWQFRGITPCCGQSVCLPETICSTNRQSRNSTPAHSKRKWGLGLFIVPVLPDVAIHATWPVPGKWGRVLTCRITMRLGRDRWTRVGLQLANLLFWSPLFLCSSEEDTIPLAGGRGLIFQPATGNPERGANGLEKTSATVLRAWYQ